MDLQTLVSLFAMANIEIISIKRLRNKYHPDTHAYRDAIKSSPWWLVEIDIGVIEIGWRSSVIHIDWLHTGKKFDRHAVTTEDVTKSDTMIHAWGYAKAIEYLRRIQQLHYPVTKERCTELDFILGRHVEGVSR